MLVGAIALILVFIPICDCPAPVIPTPVPAPDDSYCGPTLPPAAEVVRLILNNTNPEYQEYTFVESLPPRGCYVKDSAGSPIMVNVTLMLINYRVAYIAWSKDICVMSAGRVTTQMRNFNSVSRGGSYPSSEIIWPIVPHIAVSGPENAIRCG